MPLSLFNHETPPRAGGRRGFPLALSLGAHAIGFVLLMTAPEIRLPPPGSPNISRPSRAGKTSSSGIASTKNSPTLPRRVTRPSRNHCEPRPKLNRRLSPPRRPRRSASSSFMRRRPNCRTLRPLTRPTSSPSASNPSRPLIPSSSNHPRPLPRLSSPAFSCRKTPPPSGPKRPMRLKFPPSPPALRGASPLPLRL